MDAGGDLRFALDPDALVVEKEGEGSAAGDLDLVAFFGGGEEHADGAGALEVHVAKDDVLAAAGDVDVAGGLIAGPGLGDDVDVDGVTLN